MKATSISITTGVDRGDLITSRRCPTDSYLKASSRLGPALGEVQPISLCSFCLLDWGGQFYKTRHRHDLQRRVSIHAPVKARLAGDELRHAGQLVSIHTPVQGATRSRKQRHLRFCCFNPRACARRDVGGCKGALTAIGFNPRACARRDKLGDNSEQHRSGPSFQSTRAWIETIGTRGLVHIQRESRLAQARGLKRLLCPGPHPAVRRALHRRVD